MLLCQLLYPCQFLTRTKEIGDFYSQISEIVSNYHWLCIADWDFITNFAVDSQNESERMEAIGTYIKENIQLVSLIIGLIGVVIAALSLMYELKRRKKKDK